MGESRLSGRTVEIERIFMQSHGTGASSGLGEMKDRFRFPSSDYQLAPGASAELERVWGFTEETQHEQLSYVFDICWRGEDDIRRCHVHRVDLFPN